MGINRKDYFQHTRRTVRKAFAMGEVGLGRLLF